MPREAQTLLELAQVRADNRELLNALVATQGTALGRRNFTSGLPDGEPCIIVYMPHKIAQDLLAANVLVPERLLSADGAIEARTDVVVTTVANQPKPDPVLSSENQQLVNKLQWRDGLLDHLPPGAQVGGAEFSSGGQISGYVGTLGYAVRQSTANGDVTGFLTNQHVGGTASKSMYIPGAQQQSLRIGVTRAVREHYPDDAWIEGINETFAYVRTDAAFVAAEDGVAHLLRNDVPNVGPIAGEYDVNLNSMDLIGMPVKKVGRTTGLTTGVIVAFGYGVPNENEFIDRAIGSEPANVYTDFLIAGDSGEPFSAPGDSGSGILVNSNDQHQNKALGLLWGGWPTDIGRGSGVEDLTYGINLSRVLGELDLSLI